MKTKNSWSWLPAHMPTVAAEIERLKQQHGSQHVAQCWSRGVLKGEPGWFFAAEGVLAVGTATPEQLVQWCDMRAGNPAAHLVCIGTPTQQGATHAEG